MNQSLASLLEVNRLEKLDRLNFKGDAGHDPVGHVYGGLVMSQAISAAQQTVDERYILHSMHAYFLRAGDNKVPIIYEVNPVRDGKSFISRQLVAKQNGQTIFDCSLSFQLEEDGGHHQATMPSVAPPEKLLSDKTLFEALIPDNPYGWPIEFRQVDPMDFVNPQPKEPKACIWFKAASVLPDDLCIHQQLLAYASDNPILMTALRPHGLIPFSPGLKTATKSKKEMNNANLIQYKVYGVGKKEFAQLFSACGEDWTRFLTVLDSLDEDHFRKKHQVKMGPVVAPLVQRKCL